MLYQRDVENRNINSLQDFAAKVPLITVKMPRQTDGCSCGVFTCAYMEKVLQLLPVTTNQNILANFHGQYSQFHQSDVPEFRRKMIHFAFQ